MRKMTALILLTLAAASFACGSSESITPPGSEAASSTDPVQESVLRDMLTELVEDVMRGPIDQARVIDWALAVTGQIGNERARTLPSVRRSFSLANSKHWTSGEFIVHKFEESGTLSGELLVRCHLELTPSLAPTDTSVRVVLGLNGETDLTPKFVSFLVQQHYAPTEVWRNLLQDEATIGGTMRWTPEGAFWFPILGSAAQLEEQDGLVGWERRFGKQESVPGHLSNSPECSALAYLVAGL